MSAPHGRPKERSLPLGGKAQSAKGVSPSAPHGRPKERSPADWTTGAPVIVYQKCGGCAHVWYFRREFCPACGATAPEDLGSVGRGAVHAGTLVHRAPTDEFRTLAPYRIVLVDIDEGFRMMGHGDPALAIGDRVRCSFRPLADRLLPYFEKETG